MMSSIGLALPSFFYSSSKNLQKALGKADTHCVGKIKKLSTNYRKNSGLTSTLETLKNYDKLQDSLKKIDFQGKKSVCSDY